MNRQIFFDPQRKRWKRLRRILDAVACSPPSSWCCFSSTWSKRSIFRAAAATPKRNYRAIQQQSLLSEWLSQAARRKTSRKPSEIPFNSAKACAPVTTSMTTGSYASLKNHIHQIDISFPSGSTQPRRRHTAGRLHAEAPCAPSMSWMHTESTGRSTE